MIKINDILLDASLMLSGDTLTLSMVRDMPGEGTLDELRKLLAPESAPQVRVLDEQGMTTAIYQNHAVTSLTLERADGGLRVTATLQVEPIEQTVADKLAEKLSRAEGIIGEHDAALCEVAGVAAEGQTMGSEAGAALVELAGMIAELMERVGALEAKHAQDAAGGPQDGTTDATQEEGVR